MSLWTRLCNHTYIHTQSSFTQLPCIGMRADCGHGVAQLHMQGMTNSQMPVSLHVMPVAHPQPRRQTCLKHAKLVHVVCRGCTGV